MKTPKKRNEIPMNPGSYVHLGLKTGIDNYFDCYNNHSQPSELLLDFNVDGLPLSKSSTNCFWLILCRIFNVKEKHIFVIGVYNGYNKPQSFEEFLNPLVDELLILTSEYNYNNLSVKLSIRTFICDAPARSSITGTKGHNAYHGCGKCTIEGEYLENRVAFIGDGISPMNHFAVKLMKSS